MSEITKTQFKNFVEPMVNRCHVGWSNRRVIRFVVSRLANKYATFHALTRGERKNFLGAVVSIHAQNRALYNFVTRGEK